MAINIIKEKCIGCGQCFKSCPKDAFYFEPYDGNKLGKVAAIGPSCDFCNQCLTSCKFGAIEEKKVEVQADLGDYKHVWVFAEQRDGKLMNVALELIGEGYRLAKEISEDTQVCAQQEHSHTDKCCERVLVCGQDTDGGHEHRDECYESRLICGLEEHTHSEGCKPDEGADVENEKIWEATLPKELAGDVRENVALVAASQLGYSESQRNFHFSDDAKTKNAYSRYGQWYGSPYSRWNSLFTYFCMYYAGVDKQCVPYGSGIAAWTAELEKKELLNSLGDSKPQRGDILFIDTDLDEKVDRSAVVCEVTEKDGKATAETIEGDVEGKVAKGSYQLTDKHITGFVSLENAAIANVIP